MRAHGPLMLDRFGDDELEGWSAMQFIETSSITIHADEVFGRCFIDVFSCRPFDPDIAAAIAVADRRHSHRAGASCALRRTRDAAQGSTWIPRLEHKKMARQRMGHNPAGHRGIDVRPGRGRDRRRSPSGGFSRPTWARSLAVARTTRGHLPALGQRRCGSTSRPTGRCSWRRERAPTCCQRPRMSWPGSGPEAFASRESLPLAAM